MLIPFSPMHEFYYLPPILLTHSPYLRVVLSALVTSPTPTTHLIILYVVDFAFFIMNCYPLS